MSHPIPEDVQRLVLRLRLAADEIESAARYGVPIPSTVNVGGHKYSCLSFAATEHEFAAWAEYVEAAVEHDRHHGADWSMVETRIGDGDRLPLRFHVRHGGGNRMTTTVHDLAAHLGGHVVDTDHGTSLALPGGVIYSGFTGKVRLQRYGLPVVTLGGCSDPVEVLAAAYRKAVGA